MAVVIRLSITGKKHSRSNRIVAVDKHGKRDGKFIEILGFYNPGSQGDEGFRLDKERYDYWVSKGAKPSPAVLDLIANGGSRTPKPKKEKPKVETPEATPEVKAPESTAQEQSTEPAEEKETGADEKTEAAAAEQDVKETGIAAGENSVPTAPDAASSSDAPEATPPADDESTEQTKDESKND